MELIGLEDHFNTAGGQFISSAYTMQDKLQKIKAYIFDWDGVFNAVSYTHLTLPTNREV